MNGTVVNKSRAVRPPTGKKKKVKQDKTALPWVFDAKTGKFMPAE